MLRICTLCKESKPSNFFYKNKSSQSGFHSYCKSCNSKKVKEWNEKNREQKNAYQRQWRFSHREKFPDDHREKCDKFNSKIREYRNTPRGRAATMWSNMCGRVRNKYVGVDVCFEREEFLEWAAPQIQKFWQDHPDDTPSLDRIDSDGHYEFGNVRIVSLRRNVIRSTMLMKKLGLSKETSEDEVLNMLSMAVFSVCANTEVSVIKFAKYLKKISNDEYIWDGEVI